MIDLHAHILPGIDDGPASLQDSLRLLAAMEAQGVKTVIAAAHALDGRYNATRDAVLRAADDLTTAARASGLTVQVLPSMELYLGYDLLRAAKNGQAMGLNGSKHLLVELPSRDFPLYTERALFELLIAGFRPIINHPERNIAIRRRPDLMHRLAEKGVGVLLTAASLVGRFGPESQAAAEEFLREGTADMICSDAHDLAGRAPTLPEGLAAARRFGKKDQEAEARLLAKICPTATTP